ncbi:MAG TPA: type II toxin-antitoxin system prevent-host-death family antitoxin [Gammaproteobacteria bacterium]|nr:type II toxin-antitoxin system prevent-host-death family antitoxin [Gammaproteobacteria bacterium]
MKTLSAAEANRQFSRMLRTVTEGDEVVILSRGRPVARIIPAAGSSRRLKRAQAALLRRLKSQAAGGTKRRWTRDELYDR